MTYTFESCFAARIEDFIAQKNALGFGYLESSRLLRDFDRFCMTHFPEENFLTEELCLAWATKKNTEGNNTFRNRMMPVREFARYLNRNGEAAYVLPPDIARKDAPYAPYIYTEDDILTIWDVFDHLKPRGGFPVRQYVIPAMVSSIMPVRNAGLSLRLLKILDASDGPIPLPWGFVREKPKQISFDSPKWLNNSSASAIRLSLKVRSRHSKYDRRDRCASYASGKSFLAIK